MPLLSIQDLSIAFTNHPKAPTRVVSNISFSVDRGQFLAIVGESGSGKSVTALSIMRLLAPHKAVYPTGKILFEDHDILHTSHRNLRRIRGNDIAMIFQEPMTSLNPLHTIGKQISETIRLHSNMPKNQVRARAIELLKEVGLPSFKDRLNAYPHELSGGQRQRVMIAMALANDPKLLIADEPTTALDVTVQANILKLLKKLQKERNMAVILITHDLGIVRKMADYVCTMQKGCIVEAGTTEQLFSNAKHPYTKQLIASEPSGCANPLSSNPPIILDVKQLCVSFPLKKNFFGKTTKSLLAVDHVDLTLRQGETLGIAGESGSGKSTLAYAILRLLKTTGQVTLLFNRLDQLNKRQLRSLRRNFQIVFQDPFASLNTRMSIGQIIEEGLLAHKIGKTHHDRINLIHQTLKEVGLDASMINRYPHEFSGGQRQRVAIARALVLKPKLIIFDEPTSSLDVILQLQIIELLRDLQQSYQLSYIFISHDLRVIRSLSHRILIMKDGKVVEHGETESVFTSPQNPYTQTLIRAALLEN